MELKFESKPCRCLKRIMREVQDLEQTQEIRLPDGMPDIGRVLCAWGQLILRGKEWRGDAIAANGGVMVWVLYQPEDGTQVQWVEGWLPLQGKWNLPDQDREGVIRLSPMLRSVDARTVSARKMMVRVGAAMLAEALVPYEEAVYVLSDLPDGVEVLRNTYPMKLPREAGEKTFLLDEELTLPSSCPAVEKILRYEILPQILDHKVMAGKMVFRGNALLHLLYRGENGRICSWDFEIPFSQFGDLEEEFTQDAGAGVTPVVTSLEVDRTENGALRCKCGMVVQYVVSDQVLLELAEDAYSPSRDVKPAFRELSLPAILEERKEPLSGEMLLDVNGVRVVDVNFLPDHPRVSRMGERTDGELAGVFQLLYEDDNGEPQNTTRRWEQQWTLNGADNTLIMMDLAQEGMPTAVIGSGKIQLKGNLTLSTITEGERGQRMLCGMEVGEVKQPDPERPSLILRRADGQPLWDLAKSCGTTVQAICQANQLQNEPLPGQMLLIPVP